LPAIPGCIELAVRPVGPNVRVACDLAGLGVDGEDV
jgi:hypothetical protein